MNDTPIYDELVIKYYLSKGIVPFSYPHQPIMAAKVKAAQISIPGADTHGNPYIRFTLGR